MNHLNRGKEVTITIHGNLRESIGIGAQVEVSAKLGDLEIPVPGFNNNLCKLPILGLGDNQCPVPKGETRLGFQGTIPAAAPNVRQLLLTLPELTVLATLAF